MPDIFKLGADLHGKMQLFFRIEVIPYLYYKIVPRSSALIRALSNETIRSIEGETMTRIYSRKDMDASNLKLAEEFEGHYNERIQAEPGVDRRAVFEKWASQKAACLQEGVFKFYTQLYNENL